AKRETRAAADAVLGPDAATVRVDHRSADREAEAGAARRALLARAIELLEHALLFARPQADALIRHRNREPAFGAGRDRDRAVAPEVLERIVDQVRRHLDDHLAVEPHERRRARCIHFDASVANPAP